LNNQLGQREQQENDFGRGELVIGQGGWGGEEGEIFGGVIGEEARTKGRADLKKRLT